MYQTAELGEYAADSEGLEQVLASEGPARAYIQEKWAEFLNLGPRIIDMQHRAAVVAGALREAGDTAGYEQARDVIRKLGALNIAHGKVIDDYSLERVGEALGLAGYQGLGAVPFVASGVFISIALVMLWAFKALGMYGRKLDLIESGVLTPAEAAALDPGLAPGALFAGVADIGKLLLLGAVAWFALQAWQAWQITGGRLRRNPPLEIWSTNPPGVMGEVYDIRYQHADDGENYVHDFGPGVELEALDDGEIHLSHRDGLALWQEFDMEDEEE